MSLKARLEESYRIATQNASKSAMKNKDRFDKRVKESTLDVGDKVLVRNVRIRGKHKLADKWEPTIHVVAERVHCKKFCCDFTVNYWLLIALLSQ